MWVQLTLWTFPEAALKFVLHNAVRSFGLARAKLPAVFLQQYDGVIFLLQHWDTVPWVGNADYWKVILCLPNSTHNGGVGFR